MWREILFGICAGLNTYAIKAIFRFGASNVWGLALLIASVVLLNLLILWLLVKILSKESVSEFSALSAGTSNITAVLLGVFILSEPFTLVQAAGLVTIILGIAMLKLKKRS